MSKEYDSHWLAYIAGYFDGEGCVEIERDSRGYTGYSVRIVVTNTYPVILEELEDAFGGTVTSKIKYSQKHRQVYQWRVLSRDVYNFIDVILPYLREKKLQAKLAKEYCEEFGLGKVSGNSTKRSAYEKKRQEWYYQELRRLKKVEYPTRDASSWAKLEQLHLL